MIEVFAKLPSVNISPKCCAIVHRSAAGLILCHEKITSCLSLGFFGKRALIGEGYGCDSHHRDSLSQVSDILIGTEVSLRKDNRITYNAFVDGVVRCYWALGLVIRWTRLPVKTQDLQA
jgi:hypothetical protein